MVAAAASGVHRAAATEVAKSSPSIYQPIAYQVSQTVTPWVYGSGQAFLHSQAASFARSAFPSPVSRTLSRALPHAYVATRTASSSGRTDSKDVSLVLS